MKIALSLLIFFSFAFAFTSRGGYDGYELENFLTARNIVINQSVAMESGHHGLPGIADTDDGRAHYTRHGLAQPILEVPFFIVGHLFQGKIPSPKVETSLSNISSLDAAELIASSFLNIVLSALIVVMIYLTSLALLKRKDISLVAALIAGFATLIWPYSAIGLEPLLTFSFLATFYFLFRNSQKSSFTALALAGLSSVLLINSKSYGFYLALPLIVYALAGLKKNNFKELVAFFLPVLGGLILFIWYNNLRFGNPIGISLDNSSPSVSAILANIIAMALSFGKSLFIYSPVLLLGLFEIRKFFRKYRRESLVWLAALLLVIGLLFQFWFLPYDEMWGPRYLLVFVPFLAILSAVKIVDLLKTATGKVASVTLIAVSIWVQLVGLSFFGTDPLNLAFQAGARNMDEINYVPEFSPVYVGSLMLASEISKSFTGNSLVWSKTEQPSWSGSGQEPKTGPTVSLSREGGLVPLVFRSLSKTPALAMSVFLGGIALILSASFFWFRKPILDSRK